MEIKKLYTQVLDRLLEKYKNGEARSIARIVFEDLGNSPTPEMDNSDVAKDKVDQISGAIERLLDGEPVNYVTGIKEFYGLRFHVDENVLIPRPETEELVQWVVDDIQEKKGLQILDIGTGSGCIPITIDHLTKGVHLVEACDISSESLEMSQKNNAALATNVSFFWCDALKMNPGLSKQYDIMVSNPPYILKSEKALMSAGVIGHEPDLALYSQNEDPLQFYLAINRIAKSFLKKDGSIYYEISSLHRESMETLMENDGFGDIEFRKDISGNWRMCKSCIKKRRHVIFIIGVSGSGKTTIGRLLASRRNFSFLEGDDYHPPANIEKMSAGIPLTDEDRWPWLKSIASAINDNWKTEDIVVTCSALKSSYREMLQKETNQQITWIALKGKPELIKNRMAKRDHFMPSDLLESQLSTWENPPSDVTCYDIELDPEEIVDRIISKLEL